ncbi:DNA polymerase beta superfamily protein [Nanoarchaeota archaeon]
MEKMKGKVSIVIRELCKRFEREYGIKILFSIENGSRAWRMESKDSDYDVRFVYHWPLEEYISLKKPKDVIERSFDLKGNAGGKDIDIVGFDIFKYLSLLVKSNPTAIEWVISDIVYYSKQNKVFQNYAKKNFNPLSLVYHYKSLSKNNYIKYIKSGSHVSYKKYLYALRGLVNAKYVIQKNEVPPIILLKAVNQVNIPKKLKEKIKRIIGLKKQGKEKNKIDNIEFIDKYIEKFLSEEPELVPTRSISVNKLIPVDKLNREIRKILS